MIHSVVEKVFFPENIELDECIQKVSTGSDVWMNKALWVMLIILIIFIILTMSGIVAMEFFKIYLEVQSQKAELIEQMIHKSVSDYLQKLPEVTD